MEFRENIPLAPYTTFQIGGPARWFAEAHSEPEIVEAILFARDRQLPLFVLGGGSNLLVADAGFPGVVLRVLLIGIERAANMFSVAAGENWDDFVSHAVALGFGGVECLAGIPGSTGGTPIQNVGAYGQEVASCIRSVRALDRQSMRLVQLTAAQCGFAYRQSIFNASERGRYVVTRVDYRLEPDARPLVEYPDLRRHFHTPAAPSLACVAAAVREIRAAKGMLLVPGEPDCRSAGSFFKNPIVDQAVLARIGNAVQLEPAQVPHYPAGAGRVKLPAAWLLEQAGFSKGFALGEAAISTRHTLALTNRGRAGAADILKLRDRIVDGVSDRFGLRLESEPVLLA